MDSNAISVGVAIQSGVVLQKCGNYWCKLGTSQVVNSSLINSISSNVISLVETYQYNNCSSWITQDKGLTKLSNSCAVDGNGLMYDNCEGGTRIWIYAKSYCSSKGMRLPDLTETTYSSGRRVPSCGSWTWTETNSTYGSSDYTSGSWVWYGTSRSDNDHVNSGYVRCVK